MVGDRAAPGKDHADKPRRDGIRKGTAGKEQYNNAITGHASVEILNRKNQGFVDEEIVLGQESQHMENSA